MSQSLSKVYVHITFSTKNRYPFIDNEIEQELWAYLGGICKALECNPNGYGIFSVNPSEIETVVKYIGNQHVHHKRRTFQEELLAFLKKYNMEYDERYLWD